MSSNFSLADVVRDTVQPYLGNEKLFSLSEPEEFLFIDVGDPFFGRGEVAVSLSDQGLLFAVRPRLYNSPSVPRAQPVFELYELWSRSEGCRVQGFAYDPEMEVLGEKPMHRLSLEVYYCPELRIPGQENVRKTIKRIDFSSDMEEENKLWIRRLRTFKSAEAVARFLSHHPHVLSLGPEEDQEFKTLLVETVSGVITGSWDRGRGRACDAIIEPLGVIADTFSIEK